MRRAPWFVSGLLAVSLSTSAGAAEKLIGVVGGGLYNNMPALAGTTIVHEPISLQPQNKRDFGAHGGLIFEISWQTFGALRFEPKYMRKGADLTVKLQSTDELVRGPVELDYVSLPIMFKSTIFRKKPIQLVLISGVSADYLASAKFEGKDEKDTFESWDYTVTARIGFQFKIGDGGLLGAHFMVASSIAGIDKSQPNQGKLKNNGIGFAVEFTQSVAGKR